MSLGLNDVRIRSRAIMFLAVAAVWVVAVQTWTATAGVTGRSGAQVGLASLSVVSCLGTSCSLLVARRPVGAEPRAIATAVNWVRRFAVAAGVIGIPVLASIVTLDGTSVFAAVGAGSLIAVGSVVLCCLDDSRDTLVPLLGSAFVALFSFPVVLVDRAGTIRLPCADLVRLAGAGS